MTATKENARPVVVATGTGRENDNVTPLSFISVVPHRDSTTQYGTRQHVISRNFTNGDIFQQAKEAVTMPEAAALYGYTPNRAGFIRCPFHGGGNEKTPSCKLYENGWHCFGCQTGGTVIDFTARLFDLSPLEAVKRLNTDFSLGLSLDRHKPTAAELKAARKRREVRDAQRRFENWRHRALWALAKAAGVGEGALRDKTPDTWSEAEILAIKRRDYWDYITERLEDGDESERVEILRDWPVIGADVAKAVSVNG